MFGPMSSHAFAAATAPLLSNFGDGLTLWRDGNVVHWSYDEQTVIVEMQHDGTATASFVDRPVVDGVDGKLERGVYRRVGGWDYRLTADGSRSMVADMMAFLSGDREPHFAFTGTQTPE
jgi:hypothetical protein